MADSGTVRSKEYMTQIVGSSLEYAVLKTMAGSGLSISSQELGRRLISRVYKIGEASEIFWRPGVYGLLSLTIDLGIPTALITSSYGWFAHTVVEDAPPGSLAMIVAGDYGLPSRPDSAPYLRVAELTGVDPSSSLVVEDSMLGARSGMAARTRVVHVSYVADVSPALGLIKIDFLESVDETTLRHSTGGKHPQDGPYVDSALNLGAA